MSYDPDIEAFFAELRSAKAASDDAEKAMPQDSPQRIVVLDTMEEDVVARHMCSFGQIDGVYRQSANGEIFFCGRYDGERRWYVNKSMTAFRLAAAAFNRCCSAFCNREESDEATSTAALSQLRAELEAIEPLGDAHTSLWSCILNDPNGGGFLSSY